MADGSRRGKGRAEQSDSSSARDAFLSEEGIQAVRPQPRIVCSTAAPHPVIRPELVRGVIARRCGRPLVFIDIAVPRVVDPAVRQVSGALVYDLDDLQTMVDKQHSVRRSEVQPAEAIVEREAREFQSWLEDFQASRRHALRHYCPVAVEA